MRIYWLSFCLLTVCLGLMLPGHLFADGAAVESEALVIRDTEPEVPREIDVTTGRDDVPGGTCEPIGLGDVLDPYVASYSYRGNWFDVIQDAIVTEFGFYLLMPISTPVTLYFSCHEEISGERAYGYFQRCSSLPNDIEIDVPATTDPEIRFYSTGEIETPIPLEAGKSYVLGIAWGLPTLVYARDEGIDGPPRLFPSFPNGMWRGSVSLGLDPQTEPPLGDLEDGRYMSSNPAGGPWIMEICMAGACCLDAGGCEDKLEADCLDVGEFTCPGLTCDRLAAQHLGCPLVKGACCVEGEECVFECLEIDKFSCVGCNGQGGVGGTWNRGVSCREEDPLLNPCLCKGACCLSDIDGNGMCSDGITEEACLDVCGHYGGRDTTCDTVEPCCTVGACCVAVDDCLLRRPEDCSVLGGDFLGFGVPCDPNPCIPSGACCVGDICSELTEDECQSAGGNYRGDKTTCDRLAVVCGKGACCHEDLGCVDANGVGVPEDTCLNTIGGVFQGDGTSCVTLDPPCPGVCCSWECYDDVDPVTCVESLVGVFAGYGTPCPVLPEDPDPCDPLPSPVGACCLPTGACTDTTQDVCDDLQGEFISDKTCSNWECSVLPRTGACCLENGGCDDTLTEDECLAVSEQLYQGDGVKCTQVDCTRGPCCLTNGTCVDTIGSVCTELCGYLDTEPDCTTADCGAGACCLLDESCATYTLAACESLLGFHHEGEVCGEVNCERGACCLPDELCDLVCGFLTWDDCTRPAQGGIYRGNDTECIPYACTSGACCFDDGGCNHPVDGLDCALAGGSLVPLADDCSVCPPANACCLPNGICANLTQEACETAEGSCVGDDVLCENVVEACDLGACCRLDGTCLDERDGLDHRFRFQCEDDKQDEFYPHNIFHPSETENCDDLEPPCRARGACCPENPLDPCELSTFEECSAESGTYRGDTVLCLPDDQTACMPGACCFEDGGCDDADGIECTAWGGYFVPGAQCDDPGVCPPVCCLEDESCLNLTEEACDAVNGLWVSEVPECGTYTCCRSVCCHLNADCAEELLGFQCDAVEGLFLVNVSICSPDLCPVRGACCRPDDETCITPTEQECLDLGGNYVGDVIPCAVTDCSKGACCMLDGSCVDDLPRDQCEADYGISFLGSSCAGVIPCEPRGACCVGDECTIETEDDCTDLEGDYVGSGIPCDSILDSDPPNCAIDARQPHALNDETDRYGWGWTIPESITLTLPCPTIGMTASDFIVTVESGTPPTITNVTPDGNTAVLELSEPIPTGQWTCFALAADPREQMCLGYLPADVNADLFSNAADVLSLIDCVNGTASCEIWQCDVDRDNECGPTDILRAIDLLNGAAEFGAWLDESLLTCPSE